ncbi:acyltransferase family protein [Sediminicola luteus]|uniref:Acyltransferase 3 domain-containing protein n=1 Tax=Sediminicola luteus TaxID=319238 RepID=A0A2A4G2F5_9FLAO|nr:acyltransferase [Sediminicola luteus]PCE62611.1 hypothetical protein B7P33_18435 [Sediminicola luteus]
MGIQYYKNLDGLRAIAALMVVLFHFFQNLEFETTLMSSIKSLSVFGRSGVDLFFVLSGFLITRILLANKDKANYFRNFYGRRTLRIFPLYYFFLFLYYFVKPIITSTEIPSIEHQVYFYLYLQNILQTFSIDFVGPGHFWSLAIEEHFYLFWPLLIYFFNKNILKKVIVFSIALALILRCYFLIKGYDPYYFTLTRIDGLTIGAFISIMEIQGKIKYNHNTRHGILSLFILTLTLALGKLNQSLGLSIYPIVKYSLFGFGYFHLILFIITLRPRSYLNGLFASKPLIFMGRISYGLYVYQFFALDIAAYLARNRVNLFFEFILSIFLLVFFATLSYYLFEVRFLKLKSYFQNSKKLSVITK